MVEFGTSVSCDRRGFARIVTVVMAGMHYVAPLWTESLIEWDLRGMTRRNTENKAGGLFESMKMLQNGKQPPIIIQRIGEQLLVGSA